MTAKVTLSIVFGGAAYGQEARRPEARAWHTGANGHPAIGANQRWSLDFVSDALASSRKVRILTVVDDFSRECLAPVVDNSLSGARVTRELDHVVEIRGAPCMIVSDNGTELTSHAMFARALRDSASDR